MPTAYTSTHQMVNIFAVNVDGKVYTVALVNEEFFIVTGTPPYIQDGDDKIYLFDENMNPDLSNLKDSMPFYFPSDEEEDYETSDPEGTYRFDDAQRIDCSIQDLGPFSVRTLEIKVAVIKPGQGKYGFEAGTSRTAYIFVYTYIQVNDQFIGKYLRCTVGKVYTKRNNFYKSRGSQVFTVTEQMKQLANVIKFIRPTSSYATAERSIAYWTKLITYNVGEVCKDSFKVSNPKFTAPLRCPEAAINLKMMSEHFDSLQALVF